MLQSKTQKPVRIEISEGTRASLAKWMEHPLIVGSEYLWPGRFHERLHISTRRYARIVRKWVSSIGLEVTAYGTQSMRRTKVTQIYKKTGNLRAVVSRHIKWDIRAEASSRGPSGNRPRLHLRTDNSAPPAGRRLPHRYPRNPAAVSDDGARRRDRAVSQTAPTRQREGHTFAERLKAIEMHVVHLAEVSPVSIMPLDRLFDQR